MIVFILFVLLIILGVYSYNTRQKLINVANLIDQVHVLIDKAIVEDRQRIQGIEDTLASARRAAANKRKSNM